MSQPVQDIETFLAKYKEPNPLTEKNSRTPKKPKKEPLFVNRLQRRLSSIPEEHEPRLPRKLYEDKVKTGYITRSHSQPPPKKYVIGGSDYEAAIEEVTKSMLLGEKK